MGIAGTIARNTTWGFMTSVMEMGIAFVMGIALARGLGTEQYGLYAYLIWFIGLIGIITNLGLGEMTRRFIPEAIGRQDAREPVGFVQLTLVLRTVVALVASLVVIFTAGLWARMAGEPAHPLLFIIAAAVVLPQAIQFAFNNVFKGFQRFEYAFYVSLAMHPLRLVMVLVLMALGFGVMEILILTIGTLLAGVLVGFFLLRRLLPLKSLLSFSLLSSDTKKRALKYALTIAGVLALGYLVTQQAEVFFIGLYRPVEDVGFYNLAFRVSSMVALLPLAATFALLPAVAESFGSADMEKVNRIYHTSARYLMLSTLPLAVGGIALAGPLITLLYGVEYAPAVIILQVLILPFAIGSIAGAGDAVIRGINRPGFILKVTAILAALKISLLLWLVPGFGGTGAAIASSVPRVLALFVYIAFVLRNVGAAWPVRDTVKIFLASLIMGLIVYVLQSQLDVVPSLILGIPLGIMVYALLILSLGVIREPDLVIFKGIQDSLPVFLRKHYISLIRLMERIVMRKKIATEP